MMKSAAALMVLSLLLPYLYTALVTGGIGALVLTWLISVGLFIEGNSTGRPFLLTSRNGFLFDDSY
ncbi:hypothetical protein [Halobacillus litoralis]|uniref:hypothetical protein n=1 Tax=Halobacillus litoralis TaxID=45668 RepID=UPI001CD4991C|nr:hypothetical protein [Halobacillus litoralis]MCA1023597.1 hypothetical protein [Halobacillus litoralis]